MFYCYEILKKKGKFGIIWLASTNPKLLSRRDLAAVNISRSCSDLENYIHQAPLVRFSSSRLSLYLSARLMSGIALVSRKQHDFLFDSSSCYEEDVRSLWVKLSSWRSVEMDVNILPPQRVNVTLDDRKLFDVAPDFGQMKEFLTSPPMVSEYDFFFVSSPRSTTPEGSISRPLSLPLAEHEELPYTVPREDITLREMPLPEPPPEQISAPDLPPLDLDDFEAPFPPRPSAPIPPAPYPPVTPVTSRDEMEDKAVPPEMPLVTPAVAIEVREPSRPIKPSAPPAGLDITEVPDVQAPVPARRPRRALELNQFELEEIPGRPPRRRQRRRRRLIIDDDTQIPRDVIRRQLAVAAHNQAALTEERWFGIMDIPSAEPSVDKLFRTPGSRILTDVLKKPWKNIRTTAVADDTAPPGSYYAGYEESQVASTERLEEPSATQPPEVPVAADVTRAQLEEMQFREEFEIPRVPELPELSGPVSRESLREVITTPDISLAHPSEPSIQAESTRELMMPIMEVAEPETIHEVLEEIREEPSGELLRKKEPECRVSPERTPPPPSPEVIQPISPSLEKVIDMITSVSSTSTIPEQITFKELVPPQRYKRSFAANTFMRLLELYGMREINLHQTEQFGEIFITKGENLSPP